MPPALAFLSRSLTAARPGEHVILSPGFASFDMFRDYAHRAEVFRAAVQSLAHEAGAMLEGDAR